MGCEVASGLVRKGYLFYLSKYFNVTIRENTRKTFLVLLVVLGELGEVAREWSAAQGPTEQRGRQPEVGETGQEALKPPGLCDHDVSSLADEAV